MNIKHLRHPASHSKGVTLIEILLVTGLMVILLSFAIPSISGATIKAQMDATLENVQYSVQISRNVARSTESAVVMHISPATQGAAQTITFTSPGKNGKSSNLQMQDFSIPDDLALVSDRDSFTFDERGLVKNPGRVLLISKIDETATTTIDVR